MEERGPPRLALFDPMSGGHHPDFVAGIADAAVRAGHQVEAFSADPLPAAEPAIRWHPTRIRPNRRLLDGRRGIIRAAKVSVERGVDLFCDLFLDNDVWVVGQRLRSIPARVHVAHHVRQFSYHRRTAKGRLRAAYLRGRLSRIVQDGGWVVVHTELARRTLCEFLPPERVRLLGLPAVRRWANPDPTELPSTASEGPPRLLFVGDARPEKGLHHLLEAVSAVEEELILEVVGRQQPGVVDRLSARYPEVEVRWTDRFVSSDELNDAYRRASLVVLPYTGAFALSGAASGVLVEALSRGRPLLVTTAASDQLPPDYRGAVVADADDATALAAGLRAALARLPQLERSALREGRTYVLAHHAFDSYLGGLLGVAGLD